MLIRFCSTLVASALLAGASVAQSTPMTVADSGAAASGFTVDFSADAGTVQGLSPEGVAYPLAPGAELETGHDVLAAPGTTVSLNYGDELAATCTASTAGAAGDLLPVECQGVGGFSAFGLTGTAAVVTTVVVTVVTVGVVAAVADGDDDDDPASP